VWDWVEGSVKRVERKKGREKRVVCLLECACNPNWVIDGINWEHFHPRDSWSGWLGLLLLLLGRSNVITSHHP
jgi:hypothetical protein